MSILFRKKAEQEPAVTAQPQAGTSQVEATAVQGAGVEGVAAAQESDKETAAQGAGSESPAAQAATGEPAAAQEADKETAARGAADESAAAAATASAGPLPASAPASTAEAVAEEKGPEPASVGRRAMAERNVQDGNAAMEQGEDEAALAAYQKGAEIYEELVALGGDAADHAALADVYRTLKKLCYKLNTRYTELSVEAMRDLAGAEDDEKKARYTQLIDEYGRKAKKYMAASQQYDRKRQQVSV